jgi:hypothetical protein
MSEVLISHPWWLTHQFSGEIYVAPIEEEMLLGLDFLEANGVSLHLKEKELQIAGEVIPMSLGTGSTWRGPAIYPFICIPFPAVFITTSLRIGGAGSNDL